MLKPFDAPRLKLRRARYHIGDLQTQMNTYLKHAPFYLELAEGFEPGNKKWVVRVREDVPPDFAAIIGDIIHNLRASLDLLACDMVRLNEKSTDGVYFPFAECATELETMIKKRHFDRAKPDAVALLRTMKPYKGGNYALRAIHDLDIVDKHEMLLPISDMLEAPALVSAGKVLARGPRFGPIRDGMAVAALADHADLPIGTRADANFSLSFDIFEPSIAGLKKVPLGGGELVPTSIGLANLVDGVIEAFAAL